MALGEPPVAGGSLADVPRERVAGRVLYRVWRPTAAGGVVRPHPWWFASAPADSVAGGRFDLADPMGTCYFATQPVGAVLEALAGHLRSLPVAELRARRLARAVAPDVMAAAARLTSKVIAGRHGVTAALWAGTDRALTRRWAAAFRRDGWWALYAGLQHDPSGRLRGFALFDHAGAHPPTTGGAWTFDSAGLHDDPGLRDSLARYGVEVREPGDLPFVQPPT